MIKNHILLNGKEYVLFILQDTDTQLVVDLVINYMAENWDEAVLKDNIRYIKPSNRFIGQLPEEWEIKL
jgi:hypothetical protein